MSDFHQLIERRAVFNVRSMTDPGDPCSNVVRRWIGGGLLEPCRPELYHIEPIVESDESVMRRHLASVCAGGLRLE